MFHALLQLEMTITLLKIYDVGIALSSPVPIPLRNLLLLSIKQCSLLFNTCEVNLLIHLYNIR